MAAQTWEKKSEVILCQLSSTISVFTEPAFTVPGRQWMRKEKSTWVTYLGININSLSTGETLLLYGSGIDLFADVYKCLLHSIQTQIISLFSMDQVRRNCQYGYYGKNGHGVRNLGLNQALSLVNSVDKSLWREGRSVSVSSTLNGKKSQPWWPYYFASCYNQQMRE